MPSVNTNDNCPNCDEEIADIEADIAFDFQYHPYGSTTAREDLIEVEAAPDEIVCGECGYHYTAKEIDAVVDRLVEIANDMRYD